MALSEWQHFSLQFLLSLWCSPGTRMAFMAKQWSSIALQRVILCLQLCGNSQKVWSFFDCWVHAKHTVYCQQYLPFWRYFLQVDTSSSLTLTHLIYTPVDRSGLNHGSAPNMSLEGLSTPGKISPSLQYNDHGLLKDSWQHKHKLGDNSVGIIHCWKLFLRYLALCVFRELKLK